MKEIIELSVLLLLLVLSFIYSGSEVALFSISEVEKLKLGRDKSRKNLLLLKYLNYPERALITILIGNMAVNFSASIIGGRLSSAIFIKHPLFYSVFIMTFLILLFGEVLPKNSAALHPNRFAKRFLGLLEITNMIFYPLVLGISRILGRSRGFKEHTNLSKEELLSAVEVSSDAGLDPASIKILKNLIGLIDRPVTDIMIPRSKIAAIDLGIPLSSIETEVQGYPYSAVLFYSKNIDNVAGYVLKMDLVDVKKKDIEASLLEPLFIPESKMIMSLLSAFKRQKKFLAIILDEYGGTAGLVTMKDVLDSIFVRDLILKDLVKRMEEGVWQIHGDTKISDINSIVDLELPTELNTMSGYIVNIIGTVPPSGYELDLSKNSSVTIMRRNERQVELFLLRKKND
ncbi:MAG TPA: CNNM domain-containing protein [Spirochaetota bacterium]|nr:CNNM domain-containing protein [Spirochaetota bacterium]